MKWSKKDMEAANVKTLKLLAIYIGFHPKLSTQKLYTIKRAGNLDVVGECQSHSTGWNLEHDDFFFASLLSNRY